MVRMTLTTDPSGQATHVRPAGDDRSAALGAALAGPLVSTQWLCDHLGAEGLIVIDATVVAAPAADGGTAYLSGADRYAAGHIPGALFADLLDPFSDPAAPYPFTKPGAAAFAAAASALGVHADSTVVVYDSSVGQWASRLWWLFRSFGHDRVAVLDGGAVKWGDEGRPLDTGSVQARRAAAFEPRPAAGFWSDRDDVAAALAGDRPATLVCGTPAKDFAARHIPTSVSAPAARLVDRATNAFLPRAELREVFADVLADERPVIAYCGGGIAAAADALALLLLGRDDVTVYDGSLNEWASDRKAPLASA